MTDVKVQAELELKDAATTKRKAAEIASAFSKIDQNIQRAQSAQERSLRENIRRVTRARQIIERRNKQAAIEAARQIKKIDSLLVKLGKNASASVGKMGSLFSNIGSRMRRTGASSNTLLRSLVAIGATYVGIHALTSAFRGLSNVLIRANSRVENTTLSIASLLAEIERTPSFGEATRQAQGLYRQMELLAIQSPGTAANISDAFTMALGPMRRAGVGMQNILTFSRDAVAVASALRIDMPQVARDISMMATGVAGTDVRTFRVLRSMGMITETTEDWNRMALQQPARIAQRMIDIFQRLGQQSAEAFGRTWTGLASAFQDITEFFQRAFTGPAFSRLRTELGRVNEFLLKYRTGIEKILTAFGGRFARVLGRIAGVMATTFANINDNLESIAARFDQIVATFNRLRPIFRTMLIVGVGLKVAAAAIGAAFTIAGAVFGVLGPIVGALAPLLGGGGLAGVLGLGGAAAAGTAAAGGGAAAAGGAALLGPIAALAVVLAPLAFLQSIPLIVASWAAVGAVVAGIFTAISRNGQRLMVYMTGIGRMFLEIGDNIWSALVGVWRFLSPIIETLGFVIVGVAIAGFRLLASALLHLSRIARVVGGVLAIFGAWLTPLMTQMRLVFHSLFSSLRSFASVMNQFVRWLPGATGMAMPSVTTAAAPTGQIETAVRGIIDDFRNAMQRSAQRGQEGEGGTGVAPGARPTNNIDMRGSRIEVNQEFREADPDRVWIQMREAFEQESIQRTTSGFVNPWTR